MPASPRLREEGAALVLSLHVQPGAKRTEAAGVHGEGTQMRFRIRLAAPPFDGKANDELRHFLAEAFGVRVRSVMLVRGETSRDKVVRIDGPTRRPGWCA